MSDGVFNRIKTLNTVCCAGLNVCVRMRANLGK